MGLHTHKYPLHICFYPYRVTFWPVSMTEFIKLSFFLKHLGSGFHIFRHESTVTKVCTNLRFELYQHEHSSGNNRRRLPEKKLCVSLHKILL